MADWDLVLLGVGFRQAAVDLRETLAFTDDAAAALLAQLPHIDGVAEASILSTCNRTEFYLVTLDGTRAAERWLEAVGRRVPRAAPLLSRATLNERLNEDAARHLFRVGCGLESAVLGDVHIPAQLRQAYALAVRQETAGPVLAHTFPQAFGVSRRARRETGISRGTASLGAAVAALVFERCAIERPRVVVLGAGVAARDIARCLAKRRRCELVFVNRTAARAAELARTHDARWAPWTQLAAELLQADVLVAAVSSDTPVVTASDCAGRRSPTPLVVVDVGVPRNVEPHAALRYACIDDVALRRDEAVAAREAAVSAVAAMVEEEVERWKTWRATGAGAKTGDADISAPARGVRIRGRRAAADSAWIGLRIGTRRETVRLPGQPAAAFGAVLP